MQIYLFWKENVALSKVSGVTACKMDTESTAIHNIRKSAAKRRALNEISNHVVAKRKFVHSSNESTNLQNDMDEINDSTSESNLTVLFRKGFPCLPEELLIYACLNLLFPEKPYRVYSEEKYAPLTSLVAVVFGFKLKSKDLQNYLYRSKHNVIPNLGKANKGHLRWAEFSKHINDVLLKHGKEIEEYLNEAAAVDQNKAKSLKQALEEHCESLGLGGHLDSKTLQNIDFKEHFPDWSYAFDGDSCRSHFYHHKTTNGYPQSEIILLEDKSVEIFYEGKQRKIDLSWYNLPSKIDTFSELKHLLNNFQMLKPCPAIDFVKFEDVCTSSDNDIVFNTYKGQPAALIETVPSNFHRRIIRSAKCSIYLQDFESKGGFPCNSCRKVAQYLRTIRSTKTDENNLKSTETKFARLDQLKHNDLLNAARETSRKLKIMHDKVRRLEAFKIKMTNVGPKTNDELTTMFKTLRKGLEERQKVYKSPLCKWALCNENFGSCEELLEHAKSHVLTQDDQAPCLRIYHCEWKDCGKTFGKKRLLENHLICHTGDASTAFLEILLNDQAKALTTEARQMRWHPLVIKWCLRLYNKSHSSYNALQDSGVLKLPTGRTLSDYKNFNKPGGGWNGEVLNEMRKRLCERNLDDRGRWGGLFFDEVKVKEGLVFDQSTWELVGFTDLGSDEADMKDLVRESNDPTINSDAGLATHVLQFFFKSLFANFEYPCAYFLTNGVKSSQLNNIFWEGVSVLHSLNFQILLVCCDGAASNRAFVKMNTRNGDAQSEGYNFFSQCPLFFMSDPPHLIKKLRNNLYSSGVGEKFARLLKRDGSYIIWKHVESVYEREKKRRARYCKISSAHVHLDSLSKMRVKLAVETLSKEVADDMAVYDHDNTHETQRYINICSELFKVFNSKQPLSSPEDGRLCTLQGAIEYFSSWKISLETADSKTQAASFITRETMFDLQVSILLRDTDAFVGFQKL